MKHIPRKRFGQHFLTDHSVIDQIIEAINPQKDDFMIEIGPGQGAITHPIMNYLNHLDVVEIDRDLIQALKVRYAVSQKITIHESDALKFDFGQFDRPARIIGNLPYNISTPLLFHLLNFKDKIIDCHFMLQKEVVDRIASLPSESEYGRLSVMLQADFYAASLFDVLPDAFFPPPKVHSAIIRLIPIPEEKKKYKVNESFAKIVTMAFSQRRKTIRNTLITILNDDDFKALNLDSKLRAENLSVADFCTISNYVEKKNESL